MTDKARKMKNEANKRRVDAYWQRRTAKTGKTKSQLRREDEDARWERKASTVVNQQPAKGIVISLDADVLKDDGLDIHLSRNGMSDAKYINALVESNKVLKSENRRLQRLLTRYQEIINIGVHQYIRDHADI